MRKSEIIGKIFLFIFHDKVNAFLRARILISQKDLVLVYLFTLAVFFWFYSSRSSLYVVILTRILLLYIILKILGFNKLWSYKYFLFFFLFILLLLLFLLWLLDLIHLFCFFISLLLLRFF